MKKLIGLTLFSLLFFIVNTSADNGPIGRLPILKAPTELELNLAPDNSVLITWKSNSPRADGFYIYRNKEYEAVEQIGRTWDKNSKYHDLKKSELGYSYRYSVRAFLKDASGNILLSGYAAPLYIYMPQFPMPGAPLNFRATEVSNNSVKLEWNLNETTASEFWLEYKGAQGDSGMYDTFGNEFAYTFNNLKSNTTYKFQIRTSNIHLGVSAPVIITVTTAQ